MSDAGYVPTPVPTLFSTLGSAGYTKCDHPRRNSTVPTPYCRDCGASDAQEGSMDFLREPHLL